MIREIIWRQTILTVLIFLMITLFAKLETPWSHKVENYLAFALSEDTKWFSTEVPIVEVDQLKLGETVATWNKQLFGIIQNGIQQISTNFRAQLDWLVSRWNQ